MIASILSKKKWKISLLRGNESIILISSYISGAPIFIEVLDKVYQHKEQIAFSQFIDLDQLKLVTTPLDFENKITSRHRIDLSVTEGYDQISTPNHQQKTFVLHGLGMPRIELLHDVFNFGMTNLPNISYEYSGNTSGWLPKLILRNKLFLDWYKFDAPESVLINLINHEELLSWTSDYQLSFGVTNVNQLTKLLDIFYEVADKNKLLLTIDSERLPNLIKKHKTS